MNIIGPDQLVFGVEDVQRSMDYLLDYGLSTRDPSRGRFEALDGTGVLLRHVDDSRLLPAMKSGSKLRETIYGVGDRRTLDAIANELGRDRAVLWDHDGTLHTSDDLGFALGFRQTTRRPLSMRPELINSPGALPQRGVNCLGVSPALPALPRTLSHVVYLVPDAQRAEEFYVRRLGFVCTDRFTNVGAYLRPRGTLEHHTLFLIQAPPHLQGVEHFTFHVAGPTELMLAGTHFSSKGHRSFWGPGRHLLGSNWFWYFDSPFGCRVGYDADMDLHDERWTPRDVRLSLDTSQLFLFAEREKWAPGQGE